MRQSVLEIPSRYTVVHKYQEENPKEADWVSEAAAIGRKLTECDKLVGELLRQFDRDGGSVLPHHGHFGMAIKFLRSYKIPYNFEDFLADYHLSNWDIVGEILLLSIRMGVVTTITPMHCVILGIYLEEFGLEICSECGLSVGPWCSMYFLYSAMIYY